MDTKKRSGWSEFITEKHMMLDEFERAKEQEVNRPTKVNKGKVAEAEFRRWLKQFIPKKYGVTSGYIISQKDVFISRDTLKNKLLHYDVIIYDELNSPILWVESNADRSEQGKIKAIPAEYVHGVLEVKSTLNYKSIRDALKKLDELSPLLAKVDDEGEYYKKYIPNNFYMGLVFFELLKQEQDKVKILSKLIPTISQRGFMGGIVLKAEGLDKSMTGKFEYFMGNEPARKYGKDGSLMTGGCLGSREIISGKHVQCLLSWSESNFSSFAFNLIAVMNGTYQLGFASSLHGLSFSLP